MKLIYFDSCALVKLLVQEDDSEEAAQIWDECLMPFSSRLTYPEVCAAISRSVRNHELSDAEAELCIPLLGKAEVHAYSGFYLRLFFHC